SFYLLGVCLNSVNGQTSKFEIGLEGGPGATYFYGNDLTLDYLKPIISGYVGVLFQYHFSKIFSIKTGCSYERKGANFKTESWEFNADYVYHLNYFTVPALIQVEFGNKVRFFINTGPYFSYLLSQKYSGKASQSGSGNRLRISSSSEHNQINYDFGINTEIGMKMTVSKKIAISVSLADHLGLCNTKKQPLFTNTFLAPVYSDNTTYNNSIFVVFGISYGFGAVN
ncbi:MAG: porin family protein, partial [Bacteroidales bacterium]|nr:porin family protein [Bacteroidales bacterium]